MPLGPKDRRNSLRIAVLNIIHEPGSLASVLREFAVMGAEVESVSSLALSEKVVQVSVASSASSDAWSKVGERLHVLPNVLSAICLDDTTNSREH